MEPGVRDKRMIGIILNDNGYEQDIRELLMAFFPGEPFVHQRQEGLEVCVEGTVQEDRLGFSLEVCSREPACCIRRRIPVDYDCRPEAKNRIKQELYRILSEITGRQLPWGSLTGIRPVKIAMTRLEEGCPEEAVRLYMKDTYFASHGKIDLSIEIARRERQLLADLDYEKGYSLYVGIPFCPTTCLYCSFTSFPIGKWKGKTGLYLDALEKELDYVAGKRGGQGPDTVYIGGGTPTSLEPEDLRRLLGKLRSAFDF